MALEKGNPKGLYVFLLEELYMPSGYKWKSFYNNYILKKVQKIVNDRSWH